MDDGGPNTRPKHFEITDATSRLKNQVNDLQKLYDDIVGAVPEPTKSPEVTTAIETPKALAGFLNQESGRINEEADRIMNLVAEIRGALF